MGKKIRIVLIDGDDNYRKMLQDTLEAREEFEILAAVRTGTEGLEAIKTMQPDLAVTELILSGLDGLGLLDMVGKLPVQPKMIVLSQWMRAAVIQCTFEHGASYFVGKPCDFDSLAERLHEAICGVRRAEENMEATRVAGEALRCIGISPLHMDMTLKMVLLAVEEPARLRSMSREIYEACFEREDDNVKRLEHNLRYAITEAWKRGDAEFQQMLFGSAVNSENGKPSNRNFLAAVSDYVRAELRRTQQRQA